jgi:hypothetical protein
MFSISRVLIAVKGERLEAQHLAQDGHKNNGHVQALNPTSPPEPPISGVFLDIALSRRRAWSV